MKKTVFISYSWKTKKEADKIAQDLSVFGIRIVKDNLEMKKLDSIKNFMERIADSEYTLLILSDAYLNSRNCMYEVLQLFKKDEELKSVIPIIYGEVKIFDIIDRIKYSQIWQDKTKVLEDSLQNLKSINSKEVIKELKIYQDISYRIGEFLEKLSSQNLIDYDELIKYNYGDIFEFIGVEVNKNHLVELLQINFIPNPKSRFERLDKFIEEHGPNSFYYSILARTYSDIGKFDEAIKNNEIALELNPDDYETLNNLGLILDLQKEKFDEAKELYLRALELDPFSAITRLNLAVLYKKMERPDLAEHENLKILEFDPTNEKAHSNLGVIYRSKRKPEFMDKAEFHFKKAIELNPKFINGLFNYANFLKVERKKIKEGNRIYKKLKKIVKNPEYIKLIDKLMKSKKG